MTLFKRFSHKQEEALRQVANLLEDNFEPLDTLPADEQPAQRALRERAVEQILAPRLLGPPPKWSGRLGHRLGRGAIFNSGSFCIYWGRDPDTGQIVVLVQTRRETTPENGHFKYGAVGGYSHNPEQSYDAVRREVVEEVCDPDKKPIFTPDPLQYVLMLEGKDFLSKNPPVDYTAFAYELSSEDIKALKPHIAKCNVDKECTAENARYLNGVIHATNAETLGMDLMPIEKVIELGTDEFTYQQQYYAYVEVANRLGIGKEKRTAPSSPIGYTIGDLRPESRMPRDNIKKRSAIAI